MNQLRAAYEAAKSDRKAAERAGAPWHTLRQLHAVERDAYFTMTDEFVSDLHTMVSDLHFIAGQIAPTRRLSA